MSGGLPQTPMKKAFWNVMKEMQGSGLLPKGAVLGTVAARQYVTPAGWSLPQRDLKSFWCDVQPEKEGESLLMHVPMPGRVMNSDDDLGIYYVPQQDTEVLIEWVDNRPTIVDAHEWEQFIIKKSDSDYVWWDSSNDVNVKTTGKITIETLQIAKEIAAIVWQIDAPRIILGKLGAYSVPLGELLLAAFNSHVHSSNAPSTPTSTPLVPMTPAVLSQIVKLD